ncbi:unnamed protein product [Durusdinium trenchii]|uniref:Uncharacterized protein n=1 Tax=Durusdinium trenchii TaxID=1381693 RepID=A0ABP0MZ53_9DINO
MASAWPHFVPRIELDVELKALSQRLDEVQARLSRQEPLLSSLEVRLEELVDRCGGDAQVGRLASQAELMALEMRLGQQVSKEIAGRAAQKDEMEGLLLQCSAQLDALRTDVAAVQAGLVQACTDQQEFACHVQDTYLHKKEYNEESTALRKGLELREVHNQEMQAALEVLQLHSKEILRELQSQRSQVEKQEILIKVQEDGSQSFRSDLAALEHRIWEEFAPKTSVAQVFATASEAHTKLDFAMMDRATIRQRMEEELNVLKKTLYRQQSTFKELDDAVSSVNQQDQELLKFCKLLEQEQAKLKELGKRVQQQEERFEEFQSQRQQDRRVTEELHGRVLQHIDEQVIKCQATADSLSSCSTRISLEHMEKSLGLRQSLDELSQDHSQLKSHVLKADHVKAMQGEDGSRTGA